MRTKLKKYKGPFKLKLTKIRWLISFAFSSD